MKPSEFISLLRLRESEDEKGESLCKFFTFFGGPWIGMVRIEECCRLVVDSYGVNGGIFDVKISEIQDIQVLDIKSGEARIFLELVEKEREAEEIRNKIRKNLGLPAFQ